MYIPDWNDIKDPAQVYVYETHLLGRENRYLDIAYDSDTIIIVLDRFGKANMAIVPHKKDDIIKIIKLDGAGNGTDILHTFERRH